MAQTPAAKSDEELLASVKIARVPDPGPQIRRDYSPKGSNIPGLNEMVWESYTKSETMVVGCPPGKDEEGKPWPDRIRDELLKAKNYLNYLHRDVDPTVDVRGLEKASVQVVSEDEINGMDAKQRTIYRKAVPIGWVGIRFTARPPLMKGRRAQQARLRGAASTRSSLTTRAGNPATNGSKAKRGQATVSEISKQRPAVPQVPFSG